MGLGEPMAGVLSEVHSTFNPSLGVGVMGRPGREGEEDNQPQTSEAKCCRKLWLLECTIIYQNYQHHRSTLSVTRISLNGAPRSEATSCVRSKMVVCVRHLFIYC